MEFGGERRLFRLGIGEQRKIQEATNAGCLALAARFQLSARIIDLIASGDLVELARIGTRDLASQVEVHHVLVQGLLGAQELAAPAVLQLVKAWADERPLSESLPAAFKVAAAAAVPIEDEPLGERSGERPPNHSPTES